MAASRHQVSSFFQLLFQQQHAPSDLSVCQFSLAWHRQNKLYRHRLSAPPAKGNQDGIYCYHQNDPFWTSSTKPLNWSRMTTWRKTTCWNPLWRLISRLLPKCPKGQAHQHVCSEVKGKTGGHMCIYHTFQQFKAPFWGYWPIQGVDSSLTLEANQSHSMLRNRRFIHFSSSLLSSSSPIICWLLILLRGSFSLLYFLVWLHPSSSFCSQITICCSWWSFDRLTYRQPPLPSSM